MMTDTKPVAWMYRRMTTAEADHVEFTRAPWSSLLPSWTETPLYAAPQPCTDCAALREALMDAIRFLDTAPLESGYCCCGDPVEAHGYGSGHSPVDDLAYHASNLADQFRAALNGGKDD